MLKLHATKSLQMQTKNKERNSRLSPQDRADLD